MRPTIYICSHLVNTYRKFWLEAGVQNPESYFRYGNRERLAGLAEKYGFEPTKEYAARQALDLTEINKMAPYYVLQNK